MNYDDMMNKMNELKEKTNQLEAKVTEEPAKIEVKVEEKQPEVVEIQSNESEVITKSDDEMRVEQEARRQGWRPEEEFDGNPKDWVDAVTYIARGPVFKHIKDLKTKVEQSADENAKLRDMV